MDAPGKVCLNSPLLHRQKPDHRPRKSGCPPDEGSCRVFPRKRRIICDDCKSPPRSVEFGASVDQVYSEGQNVEARRSYKDGGKKEKKKKPNRRIMSCFPRKTLHHPRQSKSPSCSDEHGVCGNQNKAVKAFPGPRVLLMRLWIADVSPGNLFS